jgi:hypothetical protein
MNATRRTPEISAQRACLLAALRKRTIQILVSISAGMKPPQPGYPVASDQA